MGVCHAPPMQHSYRLHTELPTHLSQNQQQGKLVHTQGQGKGDRHSNLFAMQLASWAAAGPAVVVKLYPRSVRIFIM